MKRIHTALLPLILIPAFASVQAATVTAPQACSEIIDSLAKSSAQHRVSQSTARISPNQSYTFWINSRASNGQQDVAFKSKCVTSAEGNVVSFRIEQDNWE